MGRTGQALVSTGESESRLQRASHRLVRGLAVVGVALAVALVLIAWLWDKRPLLDSLLLGIALAMSILPEEIPVVPTVFLALGAWRLSREKVLTRRLQAVEALGAITVLAVAAEAVTMALLHAIRFARRSRPAGSSRAMPAGNDNDR